MNSEIGGQLAETFAGTIEGSYSDVHTGILARVDSEEQLELD
jgi:hypothetical protein